MRDGVISQCRSCGERLYLDELLVVGELVVCGGCGVDCRCSPEGAIAVDPVALFDHRHHDREIVRTIVRAQLYPVPWANGQTIGDLLDKRCPSTRGLSRCTRDLSHHGAHLSGELQWGGG